MTTFATIPLAGVTTYAVGFGTGGDLLVSGLDNPHSSGMMARFDGKTGAFKTSFHMVPSNSTFFQMVTGPDAKLYGAFYSQGVSTLDGDSFQVFVPPGSGGLGNAEALDFDSLGRLLVASNSQVFAYDASTGAFLSVLIDGGGGLAGATGVLDISQTHIVPEPASGIMLLTAIAGLTAIRRRLR